MAIARTLSHTTVFNEVVREQITQMKVGERYEKITDAFNSIRDDAKSMVDQLDDGKISTMERLQNLWMRFTRGDIPDRFRKIKETYLDVTADTKDQIEREMKITRIIQRLSRGPQRGPGDGLPASEEGRSRSRCRQGAPGGCIPGRGRCTPVKTVKQIARLELDRDQRLRELQDEDKRYQIVKDLAENLSISYNTTEVVMARLAQSTEVKERVYSQAVSFFGTNETVFTALNASFTSLQGLHESTRTLDAMKEGVNQSLETIAEVGGKVQEDALRAGYGPTIKAASVKKLVDSVVNFQEKSRALIAEMRDLATRNEQEISAAVEISKKRMAELANAGAAIANG